MRQQSIDKTIIELTKKLYKLYPLTSDDIIKKNDGIYYWKGKKIISIKEWNELYDKNSISKDNYKNILVSRKPLQYFPDDYNDSIFSFEVADDLKLEAKQWDSQYFELLEFRKNSTLGRKKCSKCLLSASLDDPIFDGIERVFARIVSNHCKTDQIRYPCKVMNIFECPFVSKNDNDKNREESKYPYKREELFALQRIAFAIELTISHFLEITRNNEIIYQVDFENDRVQESHTNCYGEPQNWGWKNNIKQELSKVKPILNIKIRNKHDIYNILINREKLEYLLEEYNQNQEEGGLSVEQQIVKDNRDIILDFTLNNKDSIKVEDLKVSEPIYKCYKEKSKCSICGILSNIYCINCENNDKVWLCVDHWQQHAIEEH